ncbi:MAG: two-component system response regulator NarL [Gammaproteobacteria bacterium]|nr:MAG: two-component system response regulator NarL [Gammaproteobacteria bacterium]
MQIDNSVLIIDDHPLFRKGVCQLISDMEDEFKLIGEAPSGEEGIKLALQHNPDLILLDLNMKGMDGIETLIELKKSDIDSFIVVLTVSNDEKDLVSALRNGADGYLLKDLEPEVLKSKLQSVMKGQVVIDQNLSEMLASSIRQDKNSSPENQEDASLTVREKEILQLIAHGNNNKLIARELNISDGTVKVHVKNLLRKLKVHSRLEAAVWALSNGFGK